MRVRAVAPAMTRRCHDQVVLYVMYLCRKTTIMFVVKTMDCRYDIYALNFNCHCFAVLSCCICALFWRLPI
jgi:hypothetical protein